MVRENEERFSLWNDDELLLRDTSIEFCARWAVKAGFFPEEINYSALYIMYGLDEFASPEENEKFKKLFHEFYRDGAFAILHEESEPEAHPLVREVLRWIADYVEIYIIDEKSREVLLQCHGNDQIPEGHGLYEREIKRVTPWSTSGNIGDIVILV